MRQTLRGLSLLIAAFVGGMMTSEAARAARSDTDDTYRTLAVFARILNFVERNYVTPIAAKDLIYGAVRGMLVNLDPHSAFLDPEQYAALQSESQGEFGGIGVELVRRADGIHVVERYADSPAIKAGLLVGDVILGIDDLDIVGRSLTDVVRRIKGPSGTAVRLRVRRRTGRSDSIVLQRERIRVISVDSRRLTN
ncbi:MAG: PDZ domain-containing protein, partial [Myxococcota bacterium]